MKKFALFFVIISIVAFSAILNAGEGLNVCKTNFDICLSNAEKWMDLYYDEMENFKKIENVCLSFAEQWKYVGLEKIEDEKICLNTAEKWMDLCLEEIEDESVCLDLVEKWENLCLAEIGDGLKWVYFVSKKIKANITEKWENLCLEQIEDHETYLSAIEGSYLMAKDVCEIGFCSCVSTENKSYEAAGLGNKLLKSQEQNRTPTEKLIELDEQESESFEYQDSDLCADGNCIPFKPLTPPVGLRRDKD